MGDFISLKKEASVQYNDFTGYSSIDNQDDNIGNDWYYTFGLSREDHFILGISLYQFEMTSIPKLEIDYLNLEVYYVLTAISGDNFGEIQNWIRKNDGNINVKTKSIKIKPQEISLYFKRFNLVAFRKGLVDYISGIKREEEE